MFDVTAKDRKSYYLGCRKHGSGREVENVDIRTCGHKRAPEMYRRLCGVTMRKNTGGYKRRKL